MIGFWRKVKGMFHRAHPQRAVVSQDVQDVVHESRSKAQNTNDLIMEVKRRRLFPGVDDETRRRALGIEADSFRHRPQS